MRSGEKRLEPRGIARQRRAGFAGSGPRGVYVLCAYRRCGVRARSWRAETGALTAAIIGLENSAEEIQGPRVLHSDPMSLISVPIDSKAADTSKKNAVNAFFILVAAAGETKLKGSVY